MMASLTTSGCDHGMKWLVERAKNSPHIELRESFVRHYSLIEQLLWPLQLYAAGLDVLHVPHFNMPWLYIRPYMVTIHDLLWHTQRDARATTLPPWLYRLKYWGYRFITSSTIRRARAILVPSKTVEQEVSEFTGRTKGVFVTPEGIAQSYMVEPADDAQQPTNPPYVVYTGSLYPHKNLETVWKALQSVSHLTLKVVSARSVFLDEAKKRVKQLGVEKRVEFLNNVADEKLVELYRKAVALVQPSKAEGFGLTPLEALAVGCPVIVSDRPIFHEVLQVHAKFVDPYSISRWAQAMRNAMNHPMTPQQKRQSQRFAQTYTWERCVSMTQAVYTKLLSEL